MSHLSPERLNLYLDNELDDAARAVAEAHLAGCATCQAELRALETFFAALATLPPEPMPVDLTEAILARLPAPSRPWPAPLVAALLVGQVALTWALVVSRSPALGRWVSAGGAMSEVAAHKAGENGAAWLALGAATLRAGAAMLLEGMSALVAPLSTIVPAEWGLLVGLMGLLWLVGNGLLLRRTDTLAPD